MASENSAWSPQKRLGDLLEVEGRNLHPIDVENLAAYKTHITIHLPEWGENFGQSAKVWNELNPRWGEVFLTDAHSSALQFVLKVHLTSHSTHTSLHHHTPFPPFPGQKDVRAVAQSRPYALPGQSTASSRAWVSIPTVEKLVGMYRHGSSVAYDQLRSLFGLEAPKKLQNNRSAQRRGRRAPGSEPATDNTSEWRLGGETVCGDEEVGVMEVLMNVQVDLTQLVKVAAAQLPTLAFPANAVLLRFAEGLFVASTHTPIPVPDLPNTPTPPHEPKLVTTKRTKSGAIGRAAAKAATVHVPDRARPLRINPVDLHMSDGLSHVDPAMYDPLRSFDGPQDECPSPDNLSRSRGSKSKVRKQRRTSKAAYQQGETPPQGPSPVSGDALKATHLPLNGSTPWRVDSTHNAREPLRESRAPLTRASSASSRLSAVEATGSGTDDEDNSSNLPAASAQIHSGTYRMHSQGPPAARGAVDAQPAAEGGLTSALGGKGGSTGEKGKEKAEWGWGVGHGGALSSPGSSVSRIAAAIGPSGEVREPREHGFMSRTGITGARQPSASPKAMGTEMQDTWVLVDESPGSSNGAAVRCRTYEWRDVLSDLDHTSKVRAELAESAAKLRDAHVGVDAALAAASGLQQLRAYHQSMLRAKHMLLERRRVVQRKLEELRAEVQRLRIVSQLSVGALQEGPVTLVAATRRLHAAQDMLLGPEGQEKYVDLLRHLISRRHKLVVDLAMALKIGPQTMYVKVMDGPLPEDRMDLTWSTLPSMLGPTPETQAKYQHLLRPNTITTREVSKLCIVGLELAPYVINPNPPDVRWTDEPSEYPPLSACVGYIAFATQLLARFLDIPLRYPVSFLGSKSLVLDPAPPASGRYLIPTNRGKRFNNERGSDIPTLRPPYRVPLYLDGSDQRAFNHGVNLLNANIRQILSAHGLPAASSDWALQNLYKIIAAAVSGLPVQAPPPTLGNQGEMAIASARGHETGGEGQEEGARQAPEVTPHEPLIISKLGGSEGAEWQRMSARLLA